MKKMSNILECRLCGAFKLTDGGMRHWLACNMIGRFINGDESGIHSMKQCWHPAGSIPVIGERDED